MRSQSAYDAYYIGPFEVADDELTGLKLATVTSVFTSVDHFDACLSHLKSRKHLNNEHLVRLRSISQTSKTSWCSTMHSISATYEYIPDSLFKDIHSRKAKSLPYTGQELLRIAYDLIDALAFLQTNHTLHNSIVPSLIFLSEDVALGLKRAKLMERLNATSNHRTNITSALAMGFEIYQDQSFFQWYITTDKPMNTLNHYKLVKQTFCIQFGFMSS